MPNKMNKVSAFIFSTITFCYGIYSLLNKEYFQSIQGIAMTLVFLLITYKYSPFLKKDFLLLHTNIFLFTAAFLGLVVLFYQKIPYYDLAMHLYAGILLSYYGFLIYEKLKSRYLRLNNAILLYILIFFFSVTLLVAWECAEYLLDIISLSDHTNSKKSGVNDTMTDLLIGMFGTILTLYFHHRKKKKEERSK